MKIKTQVLSCCMALLMFGCSDSNTPTSATVDKPAQNNVANQTSTETKDKPAYQEADKTKETEAYHKDDTASYAAKLPSYLEQNWTHDVRMEWWYTNQGSRLLPYDWFLALEQPDNTKLISAKDNLEKYRFIAWPADAKWNPDGLPIGFVSDKDTNTGTRYLGFTCAACHTGKIAYKGKEYIVEGAPAHHDFDHFTVEIATSMQKTLADADKWSRFVKRVLGDNAKPEDVTTLKSLLEAESNKHQQRIQANHSSNTSDYARLDAFGSIFNAAAVFAINEPSNANPADAPVSYPVLWDTPQHEIVQWNGSAVNAGIGPYSRNAGEVVGVYGDLHIEKVEGSDPAKMNFKHHINIAALTRLEGILTTLWSPLWPEDFPAIDQTKAQRGKPLFENNCNSCHQTIKRDDPQRTIAANIIPLADIGTDPTMVKNIISRTGKTGILQGQPSFPLPIPNIGTLGESARTVEIVRYGVVGVLATSLDPATLQKGLPPFLEAAKKNATRSPGYKVRPLNGIWASAPFLHNGSVPNLWELLQAPEKRVTTFNVGSWEIDPVNVGFSTTSEPATSEFNTTLPNNSNKGHNYGTQLSDEEKRDLIEYLKTL